MAYIGAESAPFPGAQIFRGLKQGANATILLVIFVFVFGVILLLISALNLQHAVDTEIDNTITATVGQVRLDIQTLNDLDWRENAANTEIAEATRDAADNDARMDASLEAVVSAVRRHAIENPQIPSALVAVPGFGDPQENVVRLNERIELYKQKVEADADKKTVTQDMLDKYFVGLEKDILPVMNAFFPARDKWRDAVQKKQMLEDEKAALLAPPKDVAADRLANASYRTVVEDFRTFEKLVGDRLFGVVLIPNPVLVLLLAVFMGMLGSLIHLSRRLVIEREPVQTHEMFYRIGLGAAVALALYFFASAGVLALSQPSGGKVDTDMSPYLISFLGISAGFLSERATAWMREVGEKMFKIENGPQKSRWATGLSGELAKQNLTAQTMAAATGLEGADIEAYAALQKPAADGAQALIAAFLRVHPSLLFTDIDPKAPAAG